MNSQAKITIGSLAKLSGVSVETVRFYERKKLLVQPPKSGGFRYYSENDVRRIKLIKQFKTIGFTLDEITEFLEFDRCDSAAKAMIKQKSDSKIQQIKEQIEALNMALLALKDFSSACGQSASESNCCLIDCFENQWECCKN